MSSSTWEYLTPRQRDAAIQEKIIKEGPSMCDVPPYYMVPTRNHTWTCPQCRQSVPERADYHRVPVPAYTVDMQAAWEVLKKMAASQWAHEFGVCLYEAIGPAVPDDIPRHQFAVARLARLTPEAICKAAWEVVTTLEDIQDNT